MQDNEIKLVTADQIKQVDNKDGVNSKIKPFIHKSLNENELNVKKENYENRGIVIMKLKQNHGIIAECIARKSIGKDHAKWIPAIACAFKYIPRVSIN